MTRIHELRIALTVDEYDRALAFGATRENALVITPWGDRNARVRAPDGMQLTLFTPPGDGPHRWHGSKAG